MVGSGLEKSETNTDDGIILKSMQNSLLNRVIVSISDQNVG